VRLLFDYRIRLSCLLKRLNCYYGKSAKVFNQNYLAKETEEFVLNTE